MKNKLFLLILLTSCTINNNTYEPKDSDSISKDSVSVQIVFDSVTVFDTVTTELIITVHDTITHRDTVKDFTLVYLEAIEIGKAQSEYFNNIGDSLNKVDSLMCVKHDSLKAIINAQLIRGMKLDTMLSDKRETILNALKRFNPCD